MQRLHGLFVGTIISVFQKMDADHQADGFPLTANGTVVYRQGFVEAVPVDQTRGTEKFMISIEHIRKKSLKYKKLPLWNICFHINDLYQIPEAITTSFQQLSSVFKEPS
jgi:hypothetical protein